MTSYFRLLCKDEHVHPTPLFAVRKYDNPNFQNLTKAPVLIQIPKDRFSNEMFAFSRATVRVNHKVT